MQHIAGGPPLDEVGAERGAQTPDAVLDDRPGGLGRALAPQLVDEPVDRDDLLGVQEEQSEYRSLLGTT